MKLKLFNSLTRSWSVINLIKEKRLNIYLCGPTVYDHVHVGNLRSIIIFDLLGRLLRYLEIGVDYVNNITDIDDKIIDKSKKLEKSEEQIADKYTKAFFSVLSLFNVDTDKTIFPQVTNYLEEIKAFIEKMEKKGLTYEKNGDVLFCLERVSELNYGKLSNQKIEKLQRKNTHLQKPSNVNDFVLWKKTKEGKKWDSRWGQGRPGWHTECVVFIDKLFQHQTINIHGGGVDLLFPHHENERIQFLSTNDRELSDIWLHIAHIFWEKEKMSKSLGNVVYAKDFYEKYGSNALRYIIFSSHYQQTINLSDSLINNSLNYLERLLRFLKRLKLSCYLKKIKIEKEEVTTKKSSDIRESVIISLLDNLDTAKVFFYLEKLVVFLNKETSKQNVNFNLFFSAVSDFFWVLNLLGLDFPISLEEEYSTREKFLIDNWVYFRERRKFLEADSLRNELIKEEILP